LQKIILEIVDKAIENNEMSGNHTEAIIPNEPIHYDILPSNALSSLWQIWVP
jgi:hypothetical protein